MTEQKVIGRVIKVHKSGWGFISSRTIEFTRIFFHWTALRQDTVSFPELKTGMYVEFTPMKIEGKGYRAMHIRVVEKPKTVEVHDEKPTEEGIPEADVSTLSER